MYKIQDISDECIIQILKKKVMNEKKISVSYIGWDDFDYFFELCEEDGGISQIQRDRFNRLKLNMKIDNFNLFIDEIKKFQKYPIIHSMKKNIKFIYDMHIWTNSYYIVYNSYVKKVIIKNMKMIDRLLHPVIKPIWQN